MANPMQEGASVGRRRRKFRGHRGAAPGLNDPPTAPTERRWQHEAGSGSRRRDPGEPERLLPLWLTGGLFSWVLPLSPRSPRWCGLPGGLWRRASFAARGRPAGSPLRPGMGDGRGPGSVAAARAGGLAGGLPGAARVSRASFAAYGAGLALLAAGMARASFTPVAYRGRPHRGRGGAGCSCGAGSDAKSPAALGDDGFVAPALISLLLVTVVGVLLAINRITGWLSGSWLAVMGSHLYLGPAGWFGLLIPGVAYGGSRPFRPHPHGKRSGTRAARRRSRPAPGPRHLRRPHRLAGRVLPSRFAGPDRRRLPDLRLRPPGDLRAAGAGASLGHAGRGAGRPRLPGRAGRLVRGRPGRRAGSAGVGPLRLVRRRRVALQQRRRVPPPDPAVSPLAPPLLGKA